MDSPVQARDTVSNKQTKTALTRSSSRRGSRRFSIGSTTDKMMHKQESFGDKDLLTQGDSDHFRNSLVGFACKKGLKPVSPNQDSFLVIRVEGDVSIYGVFDGHGKKGHDVSNFVKEHLPKHLVAHPSFRSEPCSALRDAFLATQQMLEKTTRDGTLDAAVSGTTCTVVLHFEKDEGSPTGSQCLYVAHVGDSRCVLAQRNPTNGGLVAVDLTQDHKPDLPLERARIIARGGAVHKRPHDVSHRVYVQGKPYPGLAMSRALGDLIGYYDAGVSAEPETSRRELRNEEQGGSSSGGGSTPFVSPASEASRLLPPTTLRLSGSSSSSSGRRSSDILSPQVDVDMKLVNRNIDKFLVLCSDGVWEFISSQEAVDFVSQYTPQHSMEAAHDLAKESWRRWIHEEDGTVVDDITSVVIHL
ncbi:protein phosphatase 2C, putative [Perkinsus marinus ATCC 50983]|uniref:Protein phosphatase 2C, putative n=1 Tax=Perkinsus marinus (strain ATCC 50983 / TXsc) TaxID=423536 RepID=C5K4X7_PERM5|nr:protein phosphatase 2C, putative [Perkinsus marinus ATCC 50983]EER20399.1 protein phosphatase 2C, putative [Perkinsus marinus ATCC 50983]|eukprot:XP_002788603.1 protein phosphatase 2C, putative [Perkinsus marinus ATCC 50983]